jgi:sugar lactone lactonase YvrE
VIDYDPETRDHTVVVDTGGRPLGLAWHPDGSLLICDTARGLLGYRPDGRLDVLASRYHGAGFTFCSNVTAASDGTIYFTHASTRFTETTWAGDVFEHRPTGQLFRLTPGGELELLVDHLAFANGVTLAPDESFLVVAETTGYEVLKLQLTGDQHGHHHPFRGCSRGISRQHHDLPRRKHMDRHPWSAGRTSLRSAQRTGHLPRRT